MIGSYDIGTTTPKTTLHLAKNGNHGFTIENSSDSQFNVSDLTTKRSRGSLSASTSLQSGDGIGYIGFYGFGSRT